ncbi:GFA family protein [Thalassovita aquimarina]|uniref:GFA family protein n=1 Tax=Thalassovita aquimarina TaxID=2785917 RepID=A0ABS5HMU9_9RHOB|nr:GFA family protein [Thalassovita aquimarina]MBR9650212.1 GFA family protein [Thalassovita aquimarina]
MLKGSCACGKVHFKVTGQPRGATACHCGQCRKMAGIAWASADVPEDQLQIEGPVHWLSLTDAARRGICPDCGAFLFWHGTGDHHVSFALGAIDGPTGVKIAQHIFVADKGDYYGLADGVVQKP